jgi:hypothetical protein
METRHVNISLINISPKYRMLLEDIFGRMLNGRERLVEMKVMMPTGPLNLAKNLPAHLLGELLSGTQFGNVRGLMVGRDIYYWDAAFATHEDIANTLGVEYDENDRIVIYADKGVITVLMPEDRTKARECAFGLKRIMRAPDIKFEDSRDGEMTGEEYAQKLAA